MVCYVLIMTWGFELLRTCIPVYLSILAVESYVIGFCFSYIKNVRSVKHCFKQKCKLIMDQCKSVDRDLSLWNFIKLTLYKKLPLVLHTVVFWYTFGTFLGENLPSPFLFLGQNLKDKSLALNLHIPKHTQTNRRVQWNNYGEDMHPIFVQFRNMFIFTPC